MITLLLSLACMTIACVAAVWSVSNALARTDSRRNHAERMRVMRRFRDRRRARRLAKRGPVGSLYKGGVR